MSYKGLGVEQDYTKALEWFTKSAEQGNATAQVSLGYMYSHGEGVEQDYAKALEWYLKAAEKGSKTAFNAVAWTYHLMGDYENALSWAEKAVAAESDTPNVVDTLATVYEGLRRYDEALDQFEKCLKMYEGRADEEGKNRTADKIAALKEKMKA